MKKIQIQRARLNKGYFPPRFSPLAAGIMNAAKGIYIRMGEKLSNVTLCNPEPFCRALREQQEGKNRLIILFRHADKADAPSLLYAVNTLAPRKGRRMGIRYDRRPHAFFLYGKDVPNWAGALAGWIFPRLGHIPVINRGLCRESIDDIRKALKENRFPMALAPEGQVTYHAHHTFDLESGIMHMAEWAAEQGPVKLMPVALAYDYGTNRTRVLQKVRKKWIKMTGLPLSEFTENSPYSLLMEMTEKTLTLLEESFLHGAPQTGKADADSRIAALNEAILKEAEKTAGIRKSGTILDRIFRIRYRGVDTRYPENRDPAGYNTWERSRSDYDCIKAALYIRCSQIVDVLEYVHTSYIDDVPLNNRHCEYALTILDVVNRFSGGDIGSRYTPVLRRALLLTGDPLDFSDMGAGLPKKERFKKGTGQIKESLEGLSLQIEGHMN
ncbi:MAG: hypothetical protein PQJ58_20480 [Spirochaetales bacterium]|nr:hypothetical protein [Spirochaetales bacterium]